jgi:hypothetical protein
MVGAVGQVLRAMVRVLLTIIGRETWPMAIDHGGDPEIDPYPALEISDNSSYLCHPYPNNYWEGTKKHTGEVYNIYAYYRFKGL